MSFNSSMTRCSPMEVPYEQGHPTRALITAGYTAVPTEPPP
jgi:hypothetical protein